jgi:predicted membrane protein
MYRGMIPKRSSDTDEAMFLVLEVLIAFLGASMFWYRKRLARHMARMQRTLSQALPWAYPGIVGRVYTSEKVWQDVFIPMLAVACLFVGVVWLWKGAY